MKQQNKKRLSILAVLVIVIILLITLSKIITVPAAESNGLDVSEVAEQKSVIDEQAIITISKIELASIDDGSLTFGKKSTTKEVEEKYCKGWTNARVNVRKKPTTKSAVLTTYKYNKKVAYTRLKNGWSKIKYDCGYAYIKSKYISTKKNPPLSPYVDLIDNLTDDEKYLLYQITYAEAGDQTMEGQRAVIEVIFNRMLSDRYPDTLRGVLSQSGQFTTWKLRNVVKHNKDQVKALKLVYTEEPVLNTNYLMFSMGKNSWGKNYVKIDDQWFGTF